MEKREPLWCADMRQDLRAMAERLTTSLHGWEEKDYAVTPEELGYRGGKATEYIQAAVDKAAQKGGGRVVLANGDYLSGTIVLRSDVCLEIQKGARLLGSTDLCDYPEHIAARRTVMDTNMAMNQSLIFAEDCRNICIRGGGVLDGQGTKANFPGLETTCETPGRPFLMRILDCTGVHMQGITIQNPACWTQNYLNCERVLLENLTIESQSNYNNDGIDLDGCREVIVRNCTCSSGDDALCIKGASQKETRDVFVHNCTFLSSCNGFKIGTDTQGNFRNIYVTDCVFGGVSEEMHRIKHARADSGISLEAVDGGDIENVWLDHICILRAMSPLFIRLDKRGRVKPEDPAPKISKVRRVLIENAAGADNGPRGSYFIGIPEQKIEDVVLKNIRLEQRASQKLPVRPADIPLLYGDYPDAHMIDGIGDAPAYALWARDVSGLTLLRYHVIPAPNETRPEIEIAED